METLFNLLNGMIKDFINIIFQITIITSGVFPIIALSIEDILII